MQKHMPHLFFSTLIKTQSQPSDADTPPPPPFFINGGLFLLDHQSTCPSSFFSFVSSKTKRACRSRSSFEIRLPRRRRSNWRRNDGGMFMSVSFSMKEGSEERRDHHAIVENGSLEVVSSAGGYAVAETETEEERERERERVVKLSGSRSAALNTTKHLWAGAVAAMISRTFIAPLERMKLEYVVRGEQRNLLELIKSIAATEGLKGFWKGNFVNILRTAPFKSINFYAYDTYRNQLLKLSGNEETTNFERFVAGAAAGVTASLLCLPMDTIRTKLVAPGGEALGGIIGTFHHMIQTEGFFSLYKGLVPSLVSMAPSGAVFYGVYDILKSAYLHSPEGRERIRNMKQEGQELNALDQLELGTVRTLLYGAIAGCCSEVATYPFEVVRRHLQMQVRATKMNAIATCINIVERGGIPALYAGLLPSLLQVLPSAAISYFVYEFMKIVLKVES